MTPTTSSAAADWLPNGAAELLAKITAPPLPTFEEKVYDLCFELAQQIIKAHASE